MDIINAESYDVTTLLGSQLGLSSLLPVSFPVSRQFTMNQWLNVFPLEEFNTLPKLRYFGVGIRGAYNADDEIRRNAYNPSRLNMNLYTPIPIRCRPIDEDLTDAERANYRLRVRRTMNDGNEYFLYYLKVLEFDNAINFKRINPTTGNEELYELSPEYLEPTPVKVATNTTIDTSENTVVAYCNARVYVEASEILEYIRVAYEGDVRYANISEIGFFTGIDKEVSGVTGQNVGISYLESIYTMLYNHATWMGSSLSHDGQYIDATFEITSLGSIVAL